MKEVVIKSKTMYVYIAIYAIVNSSIASFLTDVEVEFNADKKEILLVGDEIKLEAIADIIRDSIGSFRYDIK